MLLRRNRRRTARRPARETIGGSAHFLTLGGHERRIELVPAHDVRTQPVLQQRQDLARVHCFRVAGVAITDIGDLHLKRRVRPPVRLKIGEGRVVREGKKVAILSLGTRLEEALKAADALDARGLSTTVADLRFAKPLDEALIRRLLTSHDVAVTVEEGAVGGLGAHVLTLASDEGLIDTGLKLRTLRLPDIFQDQDKPERQYAEAGLDAGGIVATVLKALRHNSPGVGEAGARA